MVGLRLWSERSTLHPLPLAEKGLSGLGLPLLLEGFCKPLRTQVAVPHLGEGNVLLEERTMKGVVTVGDKAAPLLHADVIVAPALCEAPDYVK